MVKYKTALVKYEKPLESVQRAVELSNGLSRLPAQAKVFIKPNIVFWTRFVEFPKWGVVTTSRVVEDMVRLLKDRGIDDITIGEGTVVYNPKDLETPAHAFETLGYNLLKQRYGIKIVNAFERPFKKVDVGFEVQFNVNQDVLESDFVVNLPVLKTHAQTIVSLGIKNIKGLIDINSRKRCHTAEPGKDLHVMVSRLAKILPAGLTLLDGIYTNERGPGFDGKMRRSNILVASQDVLSADKIGAGILGYEPSSIPHLVHAAKDAGRPVDLSDVEIMGECLEDLKMNLQYSFPYNETETLPLPMEKMGITGLSYPKYDLTLCTYCSILTSVTLSAVAQAWKGAPWDDVEILTGKTMKPTPGRKHTVLLGKCLYSAHKDNPELKNVIAVKSCPPSPAAVIGALREAGIDIDPAIIENVEKAPGTYMRKYKNKPEFDESFFRVV